MRYLLILLLTAGCGLSQRAITPAKARRPVEKVVNGNYTLLYSRDAFELEKQVQAGMLNGMQPVGRYVLHFKEKENGVIFIQIMFAELPR